MSGWAFFGGAADDLRQQLQTRRASEQEKKTYEDRITFQQKLQQEVEAARERNRALVEGIDPTRGVAYRQTASGYEETPLDPRLAENIRAQNALQAEAQRIEREREDRKFQSQLSKDEAAIARDRSTAASAAARARATEKRLSGQIDLDRARAEQARRAPNTTEKEAKRDSERSEAKVDREVTALYNTLRKDDLSRKAQFAEMIRFDNTLSAAEKLQRLKDILDAEE